MPRVLLADDSPHSQRMGERILREEGWEVVTVSDGDTALLRLKDSAPALVLADISMPGATGYDICRYVKSAAGYVGTRVVLTAGAVEQFDEAEVRQCGADSTLKKPFEATALLEQASLARQSAPEVAVPKPVRAGRGVVVLDPEQVRAAVVLALDQLIPVLTDQITEKVLLSLNLKTYAR
jgi:CheY-like chemotaxis protein